MLVKLGDIWVKPEAVEALTLSAPNGQMVCNVTSEHRSYVSLLNPGDTIDTFATIINTAGQSFGGEEDEKPEEA